MNPKISVIIPIFGTEKYLDKCITSVTNQTFKNIEIICVDDCSPDDSYKIVEKHMVKDSRISLIRHETNLGLGGARNTAIRVAKADYIASVDSDDSMLPNMLEKLWEATEEGWFDVVCCGFNRVDGAGNIQNYQIYPVKSIVNDDNDINIFATLNPAFWNKLWRKSLFTENDIFFPAGDYFEDMPTTPRILSQAKYIKVIGDRLYQYFIRSSSITMTYSAKHIIDYFKGFEILLRFLEDNKLVERYKNEFFDYVNSGLRFHSDNVVGSNMNKNELELYFRHLLMFKISFLENRDLLKNKNLGELLELIKQTKIPSVLGQTKESLKILDAENTKILEEVVEYKKKLNLKDQDILNYKDLLDDCTQENAEILKEVLKYKKLFADSRQDNIQLLDEAEEHKKILVTLTKENSMVLAELASYKTKLEVLETEKTEALSFGQQFGVSMFGLIFRFFFTKQQYIKLTRKPRLFFKDSKNSFTRKIGNMLDII